MKFFSHKKCFGYTLIESLVAVTLFTLAVTSVSSIYVVYSRAQRQTGLRQATVQQLNFHIEKIAQDIRMKRIIFSDKDSGYRTGDLYTLDSVLESSRIYLSELELGLMDENGLNKEVYFFVPGDMAVSITCPGYIGKGIFYKFTNGRCERLFTLQEVTITNALFYITPFRTPFPKKITEETDCDSKVFLEHRQQCSCLSQWQCSSLVCKEGGCLENQPIVTITLTAQMKNGRTITIQTSVASRQYAP